MFDYDGVIVDSLDYFRDSFLAACRERGYRIHDGEEFLRLFDVNMYEGMAAAGIPQSDIQPVLQAMARKIGERGQTYQFMPGMPDVLADLAKVHTLYIITSNMASIVKAFLASHALSCFADVLGSESGRSKVEKIRRVAAKHPQRRGFYIGDTAGDIIEGREAGVATVGVTWGWHGRERLVRALPEHLVDRPADLLTLLSASF
jgi:phosphoglycolate phosphatase